MWLFLIILGIILILTGIFGYQMVETMGRIGSGQTPIDPIVIDQAVKKYNENNKKTVVRETPTPPQKVENNEQPQK